MKQTTTSKPTILFIVIMGALAAFGPLSIDMYLPALPTVMNDLHSTTSAVQLTLTFFMIGLAAGNIVIGTLSDSMGRKKPLVICMVIFTLSSIMCALAPNMETLMAFRFIQGFTGGAGVVISRAIASDLYQGRDLTKFLATLMLVNGAAPILAPILGGFILSFTTWRVLFGILMGFGVLMVFGTAFKIPETLPKEQRSKAHFKTILQDYKHLVTTPTFIIPGLIQGFTFAFFFGYMSASPFIIQNLYGFTAQQYSYVFACLGIGLIILAQLTGRLIDFINSLTLLRLYTGLQILGAMITVYALSQESSVWLVILGFFFMVAPVAGIGTISFTLAVSGQKKGGSASSLIGLMQYLVGGLVTPLVGLKGEYSAEPYMILVVIVAIILIGLHIMNYSVFKKKQTSTMK